MKKLIFALLLLACPSYALAGGMFSLSGGGGGGGGTGCISTGAAILIGDGSGGCVNAVGGTDFLTPSGSGVNLTALNATQLTSGTVPNARFPATLPAASGANLTALSATQLTSGTIPDARFPAALPAITGANVTGVPLATGVSGRLPVANQTQVVVTGEDKYSADAGSTDTYASCPSSISTMDTPAYQTGAIYYVKFNTVNTGAATWNGCTLGAKTIVKQVGGITTALADGDIPAGSIGLLQYNGTNLILQNTLGNVSVGVGDVTAASSFATDNSILRADGTGKGAQATGANATLSDAGALVVASFTTGNIGTTSVALVPSGASAWTATVDRTGTVAMREDTKQFAFLMGADNGPVLIDGDDQPDIFPNRTGKTLTITEVYCKSDAGSPTIQLQKNDGSATNMFTTAITCGTAPSGVDGTNGILTTFISGENVIASTNIINLLTVSAGGTAKRYTLVVSYTSN